MATFVQGYLLVAINFLHNGKIIAADTSEPLINVARDRERDFMLPSHLVWSLTLDAEKTNNNDRVINLNVCNLFIMLLLEFASDEQWMLSEATF